MGKTVGELHAMLIEYAKGLPKKDETPQVMMIKGGGSLEEGPVYLAELLKKKKQVGSASSSGIFTIELFSSLNKSWVYDTGCGTHVCITKQGFREISKLKQGALYLYVGNDVRAQVEATGSYDLVLPNGLVICLDNFSKNNVHYFNAIPSNGIYEIDMHDLVPNVNSIYNVSTKRAKHNLDSTYLWHCRLAHISKKRIEKLQQEGLLKSTDDESFDQCVSCLSGKMTRKSFPHRPERVTDLLGIIHTDVCGPLRHVSRQGAIYFITFTDDYSRYGYVYLLKHKHEVWGCEALVKRDMPDKQNNHEEIQGEDTSPSEITSEIPMEVEGFEQPQEEVISVRRSERTHRALDRLCLNVEADEHSIGDLNEPTSYKAAMLDYESNKWIDAMNAEIQSMMDNMVWVLVDLPPDCKTVGSKWIFKKKTDMDGIVHTYKARLIAKGYTQLYGVDYEETFSPVADIRAIRILISIAAFYDYEIW
ncbi:retrotransposon protein, putative, ty1-copia subclass [Tanacetum coccineum]